MLGTSSGWRLLERGTFLLEVEGDDGASGGGTSEPEATPASSPWNLTRRDVGVGGSVEIRGLTGLRVGEDGQSSGDDAGTGETAGASVGRGAWSGGSSGILDAGDGGQLGMQSNGSRSLACMSLQQ